MQKGLLTASLTHLGRFCLSCHHIDLGHHFPRRCLMHHVASTRNTAQRTMTNVLVQTGRLFALNEFIDRLLLQRLPRAFLGAYNVSQECELRSSSGNALPVCLY